MNTLGFVFKTIELSPNAQFYIITDDEQYVQGPLSKDLLDITEGLISGLMPGDRLRLVLMEPEAEKGQSKVSINEVSLGIFDFFGIDKYKSRLNSTSCYGFNCSASCNQNINYLTGLTLESKAVALILERSYQSSDYLSKGTGALVNNGGVFASSMAILAPALFPLIRYEVNGF